MFNFHMTRYCVTFVTILTASFCNAETDQTIEQTYAKGIKISIETKVFDVKKHKISKCADRVCSIDGQLFFGITNSIPKQTLSRMVFELKGQKTLLDVSAMFDPGISQDNIQQRVFVKPYWGPFYLVTAKFAQKEDAYIAEWIVSIHGSTRVHLSRMTSLDKLFTDFFPQQ